MIIGAVCAVTRVTFIGKAKAANPVPTSVRLVKLPIAKPPMRQPIVIVLLYRNRAVEPGAAVEYYTDVGP
jgi:hypothetical protein